LSEEQFYAINKDIASKLGNLMFSRPYIAIVDASGKIRYIAEELLSYKNYIIEFTTKNFNLLQLGDYSIPLGGVNLAFFKPQNNFLIVIHSKKGPVGQLLSFKKIMNNYAKVIGDLIGDVSPDETLSIPSISTAPTKSVEVETQSQPQPQPQPQKPKIRKIGSKARRVPILMKELTGKEKFKIDTATILQLCDGTHSIEDIAKTIKLTKLKVDMIIRQFQKKGWIEIHRVIAIND